MAQNVPPPSGVAAAAEAKTVGRKVIDYKILKSDLDSTMLEKKVKGHLKEGWEPIGGISVTAQATWFLIYQAMIRYEPTKA